ncbi:MAG: threonine--tRNA ligase [Patescibacteria group bacterium]
MPKSHNQLDKHSQPSLDELRHSAAHLLAASVLALWPEAKNAIGPAVENGFYQDFDLGEVKLTEEDFPKIEAKMRALLTTWDTFAIQEVPVVQAIKDFAWNPYKSELINEFATTGKTITETKQGDFLDLCKGGHSAEPNKYLQYFKLLSLAGAYWRGDEKNKMLTRIYGTAWATQEELDAYLHQLEEARKRDHRKLGIELDLFTFSDLVGPGLPLFTPRGTIVRDLLDGFVWELRRAKGYQKVEIPHITKKDLYERSGHWEKFKDDLFRIQTRDKHEFAMKPMNCPHHTQIYGRKPHSYRELPVRYANTTMVYRDEQSGELGGLSRVRAITQDDAHVFCRYSHIKKEVSAIWDIVDTFYRTFQFELRVRLSFHDPKTPEKYLGDEEVWQKAEAELRQIAGERGVVAEEAPGEAAFYGPKLDFMAKDAIGREHQVATIQLDMNQPERFDLTCINEQGESERIVMVHAAIMGSIERFMSVLIEHVAGAFPTWLAPVQVLVIPISDKVVEYADQVTHQLLEVGVRADLAPSDVTLGKNIRAGQIQKIPYLLIVGEREAEAQSVSIRSMTAGDQGVVPTAEFLARITKEIASRQAA